MEGCLVIFWIGFHIFVFGMIFLDLKVFHRDTKNLTVRKTLSYSLFWVGLALAFNIFIWISLGRASAITFLAAYVLEASLSVDNLFVFLSIFSFLKIPVKHQHRVLFYGVLGALVSRIVFILSGIALLGAFAWMYFIFGGILCASAIYLYLQKDEMDLSESWMMKVSRRLFRVKKGFYNGQFFIKEKGKLYATTLFLTLVLVEISDVLFAVDSIPAVLSITTDPFLAYTSNVFAVLGLRSFYFFLFTLHRKFAYLKTGISLILLFVGVKMMISHFFVIGDLLSLAIIGSILAVSIGLSCLKKSG
jgi:tellurite resistance protein TerC